MGGKESLVERKPSLWRKKLTWAVEGTAQGGSERYARENKQKNYTTRITSKRKRGIVEERREEGRGGGDRRGAHMRLAAVGPQEKTRSNKSGAEKNKGNGPNEQEKLARSKAIGVRQRARERWGEDTRVPEHLGDKGISSEETPRRQRYTGSPEMGEIRKNT